MCLLEVWGKVACLATAFSQAITERATRVGQPHRRKRREVKVCDPFFTTKEEGRGTGLGLVICHRVVDEHRGTIQIESEVGKGTMVRIVLLVWNGTNGDRVRRVDPTGTKEKSNVKE